MKLKNLTVLFFGTVILDAQTLHNKAAYITAQCYTKTKDSDGTLHNPCYSCHTKSVKPNYTNDYALQESYAFSSYAMKNRFTNLFKDRTKQVDNISDEYILNYVKKDNYKKIKHSFEYLDCSFNFDIDGFDRDEKGNYTGWVAFTYKPFLGTFWPTNGSFDDVMIRLPKVFYTNENSAFDKNLYKENLQILVKQMQNSADDFNIYFKTYDKKIKAIPRLYPLGTEFLHSVRYLDIKDDKVVMANRIKELRYAKKTSYLNYSQLKMQNAQSIKEKDINPDRLEVYKVVNNKLGIYNKKGWYLQGFIEDKNGELRLQSYEEKLYCMGCHGNIGATTDSMFSFSRFEHFGWMGNNSIKIKDRNNEYLTYLKHNNSGDEFRANDEVIDKFFNSLDAKENRLKVKNDIDELIIPSKQRAIKLNKAYKVIVDEQSYIYGREAHIKPLTNIYESINTNYDTYLKAIY